MLEISFSQIRQNLFQLLPSWISDLTDMQAILGLVAFFVMINLIVALFKKFINTRIGAAITLVAICLFLVNVGS